MPDASTQDGRPPAAAAKPSLPTLASVIGELPGKLARLAAALEDEGGGDRLRGPVLAMLRETLAKGREVLRARFEASNDGRTCVGEMAALADAIVRGLADFTMNHVFVTAGPTASEQVAIAATGGYGRAELAPFSDVDLLFLLPYKRTPRVEQVVEYMLYVLWDLGIKVGHAVRSVDDCIRQARDDITIRTSLLESRHLWGDAKLFTELRRRFAKEIVASSAAAFIDAKLAERDARHQRYCDSRYVLEPNVKEGKGGLRDLQTLFWIAKYAYRVDDVKDLVAQDVLLAEEAQRFAKAENFLWTARCHLHFLTGRQEDRLTFDVQGEIARRLGYTDHAGTSGIERFMKHYFLTAKDVGDLTRILCANLEVESRRRPRFKFLRRHPANTEIDGFVNEGGRLNIRHERQFREQPVDMIRLFHTAQQNDLDIHPNALRWLTRALGGIGNKLRADADANRLFLEMITSRKDPEVALRRMNEAGVLGRFVPDFGRVVAQMQYDMYHMFTVDEHTLFAMGILHKIETGELQDEHPLSSEVIHSVGSRRALYVALLLHDIAKGRGGDHSELGAEVAEKLCPRLGMTAEETETVAWLVRWHLAMSSVAFKRDLEDDQTIRRFVDTVQSPERLRLLLVLTIADIRAVGPGRWNAWKASLMRHLYYRADEMMSGAAASEGREQRVANAQTALKTALADWPADALAHHLQLGYPAYWLSFDTDVLAHHAVLIRKAEQENAPLTVDTALDSTHQLCEVTLYTPDHPGLFSRLAGALALSGANIVDARIFTMTNGMALDVFTVQLAAGGGFDQARLKTIHTMVQRVLAGEVRLVDELKKKMKSDTSRSKVFGTPPRVIIDNAASTKHTMIEVNGHDRPGFLYEVTRCLTQLSLQIASAKISTYGNTAVDVFYVKDVFGLKVTHQSKLDQIRTALLAVLGDTGTGNEVGGKALRRRSRAAA